MILVTLGIFYVLLGVFSLSIAILFIELGRPKDILKSGLVIFLGICLLNFKNSYTIQIYLILCLNAILIGLYFFENYFYRWNQLLDKEKFKIKSLSGFFTNLLEVFKVIKDGFKNTFQKYEFKENFQKKLTKKKWVRNEKNDNQSKSNKSSSKDSISNLQTTNSPQEDIINHD
tara:strand:+ start:1115 stop:1633 length:519 start_codon:yes stop_codon:yes gene_type:complete